MLDSMAPVESMHWSPWNGESVYEFTLERLQLAGCKLVTYQHPDAPDRVVQRPIHLLTGPPPRCPSVRVHDRLSDTQLAEWYFRLQGLPEVSDSVLKASVPRRTGADRYARAGRTADSSGSRRCTARWR